MKSAIWLTMLAMAVMVTACERPERNSPTEPVAETPVETAANDAETADPMPDGAVMTIDNQLVEFPRARLHVRQRRDGNLLARLFSDDPPSAIHDDYTGNSFYFEMSFENADADELPTLIWHYLAPTSDRADTHNGIFLEGARRHLQPFDVVVEFEPDEDSSNMIVWLAGEFLLFSTRDASMPERIVGHARLIVTPEIQ